MLFQRCCFSFALSALLFQPCVVTSHRDARLHRVVTRHAHGRHRAGSGEICRRTSLIQICYIKCIWANRREAEEALLQPGSSSFPDKLRLLPGAPLRALRLTNLGGLLLESSISLPSLLQPGSSRRRCPQRQSLEYFPSFARLDQGPHHLCCSSLVHQHSVRISCFSFAGQPYVLTVSLTLRACHSSHSALV